MPIENSFKMKTIFHNSAVSIDEFESRSENYKKSQIFIMSAKNIATDLLPPLNQSKKFVEYQDLSTGNLNYSLAQKLAEMVIQFNENEVNLAASTQWIERCQKMIEKLADFKTDKNYLNFNDEETQTISETKKIIPKNNLFELWAKNFQDMLEVCQFSSIDSAINESTLNSVAGSSLSNSSAFSEAHLGDGLEIVLHVKHLQELKVFLKNVINNLEHQLFDVKRKTNFYHTSGVYEISVLASCLLFLAGAVSIVIEACVNKDELKKWDSIPNGLKYFIAATAVFMTTSIYKYQEKSNINYFTVFDKMVLDTKTILNLLDVYQNRLNKLIKQTH